MPKRRLLTALSLLLAVGASAAPAASASSSQEGMFQDDNNLIYEKDTAKVTAKVDRIKALGGDRLRLTILWQAIAPSADQKAKPAFDADDPAAYNPDVWVPYDRIVRLAAARGLGVNFNVTAPAPLWATGKPERTELERTFTPDPKEFASFVRALGTRYSGSYVPGQGTVTPAPAEPAPAADPLQPLLPTGTSTAARASSLRQAADAGPLPRVSFWSIYNEPNQPGWLTPQWALDPRDTSKTIETSPQLYRLLVDAAYLGLSDTGHANDTILIGETAPKGNDQPKPSDERYQTRQVKPALFIRRLYCLDDNLQFLQGTSAEVRGCPVTDQAAQFAAAHPGLFRNAGYAHHPYELFLAPNVKAKITDSFTTANIGDLSLLLRRVFARYDQPRPGGGADVPIWFTEYGYQTNPPDPTGVSFAKQAAFLNQAEWITSSLRNVRSLSQFLLVDDKPGQGADSDNGAYGGTFQSGLELLDGKVKPALAAYRLPLFLPTTTVGKGRSLKVFGMARTATNGTAVKVKVQIRAAGAGSPFRTVKTVKAGAARGYFTTTVKVKRSGAVRLTYGGLTSRVQPFSVRRSAKR